ncbi:MAG: metal-dependent transcriptional regulator [Treponema sp.]|nr:metal-dependent transcriptional regulator [Treponema sp.]MBR5645865.1 metal-dependent transcriptional regulator [Treponema sp.]
MVIRESAEMYLETILVLSKEGAVRSIDVAKSLNFSRPSVSVTLHNLEKEGYISIAEDQTITLLTKGLDIAKTIYERHTILTEFFEQLGVKKDIAVADACKIEHDISPESFKAIKKLVKNNRANAK